MTLDLKEQTAYAQPCEIERHDRITMDGDELRLIINGDAGKVFTRVGGDGREIVMTNADIQNAIRDDLLIVERRFYDPRNATRPGESRALRDLSEKQQQSIAFRLEWARGLARWNDEVGPVAHEDRKRVIRMIGDRYVEELEDAKAREHFRSKRRTFEQEQFDLKRPSYSAVSEWCRKLRLSGGDVRALRDRRGTGQRKSKFTAEEMQIRGHFIRRYCSLTQPDVSYLFKVMKAVERRINKTRPPDSMLNLGGRTAFYDSVEALPDFVKHLGRKGEAATTAKYVIVVGKDRGHPMDMVEGDEARLDLTVLLKELRVWNDLTEEEQKAYQEASERLWFSAVVDHATTSFLAFRIHERAPSTITALATFEMTTRDKTDIAQSAGCRSRWDQCGSFRSVRLDSATWYRSEAVTMTLSDAGCTKSHPPLKASWLRGTMERMFGVIGHMTLNNFSGQTFSNIVKRGDQDPRKGASVDIPMLEKVFIRAIVDIHHNLRNRGKLGGMTSRQAWMLGCQVKNPPPPPSGWLRRHVYGINLQRVITSEGIRVMGFRFYSDDAHAMRRFRTGAVVNIRLDLWDLGELTLFDGELSYRVTARDKRLKGMTYWQATALLQELNVIDTDYTDRTQETVDAAFEFIDAQGDIARMATSVASPIVTDEHINRVERRIRRPLRITEVSEYTREVHNQDWTRSEFLEAAWGLSDPPEGDDLDVPASQSAEAVREKYGPTGADTGPREPKAAKVKPADAKNTEKPTSATNGTINYFEEF